ncbi:TetR/AcrR family transcriptional regulator [Arthrobacter burdickii]|uniref:TetR/AcrR family transcriptional regulator C-terminal domain-containing protein n=1 Tax=Arthrobacter burdickii TaxID=3035920 RepID=A0ABT8K2A4_9MICC|nr:TetR/AcrR family transcriptional regulator C-terminal domain-containing protein [Arthrobacter burdickii]MDN4611561.1 TetR/AcrR family transcriptional regulator C-terminal domain-containing protein [Arthrobacter burdickii]
MQVAVGLADAGGLESLSMRKLAQELGVEAMSLYYHVKNKDDLIDGMVDVVFSEIVLPSPGEDWKTAMRERAESARAVLARHPWAIALMRSTPGAATLRHLDATIGCLRTAGFSPAMAGHAMSLLDSYVDGFALQEAALPLDEAGGITEATEDVLAQQQMMSHAFPNLAEIAAAYILQPGYAFGNEFRFGLQVILDGIEAAHAAKEG